MVEDNSNLNIHVRMGYGDFMSFNWQDSILNWPNSLFVELPKAYSRHSVKFVDYNGKIFVIKELPNEAAKRDFKILSRLESLDVNTATPVGLITGRHHDPGDERSAALITEYIAYSLSYHELLQGPGFGFRREKMLDAFAGLLVQLHHYGCFWGDCSLANVLYRYDADGIEAIMIDAETAMAYPSLSNGQRGEDINIMIENIAGGMADIAAAVNIDIDKADLQMGHDIARRYFNLWSQVSEPIKFDKNKPHLLYEKINRLNHLGFNVESFSLTGDKDDGLMRLKIKVGSRNFHTSRLKGITGLDALERQAKFLLADLQYYYLKNNASCEAEKMLATAKWRMVEFEPMLQKLRITKDVYDPIQAYCDLLHHRFEMGKQLSQEIDTIEAYDDWLKQGQPGYPEDVYVV